MFVFLWKSQRIVPYPLVLTARTYLDYFDVDFVSAGATFYLNRHGTPFLVFVFYFRCATRSFALLARGFETLSSGVQVTG